MATPIATTAAVIAAAAMPNFAAVGIIPPRSLTKAPTDGAVCAASPMFLMALPIGDSAFTTLPALPIRLVAPLAITPALSQEVKPAFSPPGIIFAASPNKLLRPLDNRCLPLLPAHFVNGSAISVSHAISTFPKRSAFCHSSELVILFTVLLTPSALPSTKSIRLVRAAVAAGVASVIASTTPRMYGVSLLPKLFCTPSTADCIRVMDPSRLSSIVSDMSCAAPSAL